MRPNRVKFCVAAVLGSCLLFLGSPASANVGLPTLMVVWPMMWVLLIPIILLEGFVAVGFLHVDFIHALQLSGVANAVSTLIGIPITWTLLLFVEMNFGGRGKGFSEETLRGRILAVTVDSAWLLPYRGIKWMVPAAMLFLCCLFFFMSVLTEFVVVKFFSHDSLGQAAVLSWSWLANGASYGLIAVGLVAVMIRNFRFCSFCQSKIAHCGRLFTDSLICRECTMEFGGRLSDAGQSSRFRKERIICDLCRQTREPEEVVVGARAVACRLCIQLYMQRYKISADELASVDRDALTIRIRPEPGQLHEVVERIGGWAIDIAMVPIGLVLNLVGKNRATEKERE